MRYTNQLIYFFLISAILILSTVATLFGDPPTSENSDYVLDLAFPNLEINQPVDFRIPEGETNRIFVVSQIGRIYVFNNTPLVSQSEIFLDIQDKVSCCWELGLLSLAFHPNYKQNGYFYIYYTSQPPLSSKLVRYTVDQTNPNRANTSSELVLIEQTQPFPNHNGGQIVFGPEGYLYLSLGDGGGDFDPFGNAQNKSSLLGKILRIDVDTSSDKLNYGIPSDNPFVNSTETENYREEIFAYGLRNPWRFSFDPVTNLLWNADVGHNSIEEVNLIVKGANYGWNMFEGTACTPAAESCVRDNITFPIHEYDHEIGKSITGGFVYRGSRLPNLYGSYIYADFVAGRIWALTIDALDQINNIELLKSNVFITSFGIDSQNELIILGFDGKIYQLQFVGNSSFT